MFNSDDIATHNVNISSGRFSSYYMSMTYNGKHDVVHFHLLIYVLKLDIGWNHLRHQCIVIVLYMTWTCELYVSMFVVGSSFKMASPMMFTWNFSECNNIHECSLNTKCSLKIWRRVYKVLDLSSISRLSWTLNNCQRIVFKRTERKNWIHQKWWIIYDV